MRDYLAVYEKGPSNWSGYVPDLPGVVVAGVTLEECKKLMAEAIPFHLEGLAEDQIPAPVSTAVSEIVHIG